ncbi:uncharacterized protein MELLADRAFT_94853 [Melampsora larici-populina 98AG31]|uniref:Uncharacterized protein n=1 Tax=Melampsora larici-populina (strain 98AG31 / pathotype 3-4-7) TaxID=747676 RepID=F4S860_MELLP|nr:uncharacterized protein MELLADRAFT_94853 [Melampsora larici-populina 98AG31]EGF99174.1 hypothetical protein MELLADRAFT_94853 [Melampsora larici-populina 98AG31]
MNTGTSITNDEPESKSLQHQDGPRRSACESARRPSSKALWWPHPESFSLTPDILASAGHFHDPVESEPDRTICWMCGEATDEPWLVHFKWAVNCRFARIAILERQRDTHVLGWPDLLQQPWGPTRTAAWLPRGHTMIKARLATFCGNAGQRRHKGLEDLPTRIDVYWSIASRRLENHIMLLSSPNCGSDWEAGDDPNSIHLTKGPCIFFTAIRAPETKAKPESSRKASHSRLKRLPPQENPPVAFRMTRLLNRLMPPSIFGARDIFNPPPNRHFYLHFFAHTSSAFKLQLESRYCTTFEPRFSNAKNLHQFRLAVSNKACTFSTDSQQRQEWIESLKRIVFTCQDLGENFKIEIPLETIEEVEQCQSLRFVETVRIKTSEWIERRDSTTNNTPYQQSSQPFPDALTVTTPSDTMGSNISNAIAVPGDYFFAFAEDLSTPLNRIQDAITQFRNQTSSVTIPHPPSQLDQLQPRFIQASLTEFPTKASSSEFFISPPSSADTTSLPPLVWNLAGAVPHNPAEYPPRRCSSTARAPRRDLTFQVHPPSSSRIRHSFIGPKTISSSITQQIRNISSTSDKCVVSPIRSTSIKVCKLQDHTQRTPVEPQVDQFDETSDQNLSGLSQTPADKSETLSITQWTLRRARTNKRLTSLEVALVRHVESPMRSGAGGSLSPRSQLSMHVVSVRRHSPPFQQDQSNTIQEMTRSSGPVVFSDEMFYSSTAMANLLEISLIVTEMMDTLFGALASKSHACVEVLY